MDFFVILFTGESKLALLSAGIITTWFCQLKKPHMMLVCEHLLKESYNKIETLHKYIITR